MRTVFVEENQIELLTTEEIEELQPEIKRWMEMTSNKIIAQNQQGEMMGLYDCNNYVGCETFRK